MPCSLDSSLLVNIILLVTNGKDTFPTSSMDGVAAAEATIFARLSIFDEAQFLPRHQSSIAQPRDLSTFRKRYAASHSPNETISLLANVSIMDRS